MKVLLGLTGSIAAILAPKIMEELKDSGHNVKWLFTPSASFVFSEGLVGKDVDEFAYYKRTKEVLHIELRREFDALLIAPLSANTLGKISNGLCDNVLTNVVRCWDYNKPMILAPAMNTYMWENPITNRQLNIMRDMGARIVPPVYKTLACGDTGLGALAPISDIVKEVDICLTSH